MKDISHLFDSIHDRLASQLSSMRHVRDEELYDIGDSTFSRNWWTGRTSLRSW